MKRPDMEAARKMADIARQCVSDEMDNQEETELIIAQWQPRKK